MSQPPRRPARQPPPLTIHNDRVLKQELGWRPRAARDHDRRDCRKPERSRPAGGKGAYGFIGVNDADAAGSVSEAMHARSRRGTDLVR